MTPSKAIASPSSSLRIALFGAGRHAQHHARAILRCAGAELVAVADPSDIAQAAMRSIFPGIKSYSTPEELLAAERPDVVHICTPPVSHGPLALSALKAGSHIYVEKPFTERVEDAQQILDEARAKNLLVWAGHQLLYESPTAVLAHYLPSIGRVVHVESYFSFRTVSSVFDGINVRVGFGVLEGIGVRVTVEVKVDVGGTVFVAGEVEVFEAVTVTLGVRVAVRVGKGVSVEVTAGLNVTVGVSVSVAVGRRVVVGSGVCVAVAVGVGGCGKSRCMVLLPKRIAVRVNAAMKKDNPNQRQPCIV